MSEENCLIIHISQFSWVDLYSNILKLCKNGEEFWNEVFCMLPPGALVRWCMKPASLNNTLRKMKCNFPTFFRGEFSFVLQVLKLLSIAREPWTIFEQVFTHCYQEHWKNDIHYKVHLSTLFPKRNTTFYAAFLLKMSVLYHQGTMLELFFKKSIGNYQFFNTKLRYW